MLPVLDEALAQIRRANRSLMKPKSPKTVILRLNTSLTRRCDDSQSVADAGPVCSGLHSVCEWPSPPPACRAPASPAAAAPPLAPPPPHCCCPLAARSGDAASSSARCRRRTATSWSGSRLRHRRRRRTAWHHCSRGHCSAGDAW